MVWNNISRLIFVKKKKITLLIPKVKDKLYAGLLREAVVKGLGFINLFIELIVWLKI